jgi:hypothetical protein
VGEVDFDEGDVPGPSRSSWDGMGGQVGFLKNGVSCWCLVLIGGVFVFSGCVWHFLKLCL